MINDPRLTESALCRREDPELWFPDNKGRKPKKPPRAVVICHSCPIQKECLQYALDEGERYGIWGGLDEAERRQLTRPAKPRKSRPGLPVPEPSEVRGVSWNSANAGDGTDANCLRMLR